MENEKIHELATICTRYNQLSLAADAGVEAIQEFSSKCFETTLTEEQRKILSEAINIMDAVSYRHRQSDAIEYFKAFKS